jgi:ATP-dependent DNA helicase PIF1
MRLFPTNDLTHAYNLKKLIELNTPVARIIGKHNCPEAGKGSSDAAQGLSKELFVSIGSRLMLRSNLWTERGLVNGSVGTVQDIVMRPGDSITNSLPAALIIKWDKYAGPTLDGEVFPLTPVTRFWNDKGKSCSRTQFPITLAWAITIHKSQGMTLDKAVADIGEKEFSAGLTYVALSRMKNLAGLAIDPPFSFDRLQNIGKSVQLKERIFEEMRLKFMK